MGLKQLTCSGVQPLASSVRLQLYFGAMLPYWLTRSTLRSDDLFAFQAYSGRLVADSVRQL